MKFYRLILLMLFPAGWRPALRSAAPPQNLQPDQIVLFVNTDNAVIDYHVTVSTLTHHKMAI